MIDRRGTIWTREEVEQLKAELNDGLGLEEIAEAHGRTAYGVIAKMQPA